MTARKSPPPETAAPDAAQARIGPRWLGAIVPHLTKPAFRRHSPAAAALLADWAGVIGPALAGVTRPVRLSRPARNADGSRGAAILTIRCAGPIALELQHMAPQVIARINQSAGFALVGGLRFERGSVMPPPRPARRGAPIVAVSQAGLEAIADDGLRAALAMLRANLSEKDR